MPYGDKIRTSIHGRRLGLQQLSSAETGGSKGPREYLVGPESFRAGVTTAETTSVNVAAYGVSALANTSAASSAVYTIDPPVPGVEKVVHMSSGVYLNTGAAIYSSAGTTQATVVSSNAGVARLTGFTTGIWLLHSANTVSAAAST